jgi:hypothetical protein
MMSLDAIRAASADATNKARARKKTPLTIFDESHIEDIFNAPNIGDYDPPGWKLVEVLMCDAFGVGRSGEAALTKDQLMETVREHVEAGNRYGYAIVAVGQFQASIGVFEEEKRGQGEQRSKVARGSSVRTDHR